VSAGRRAPAAAIPLALGAVVAACSFIDRFPDVAPDPAVTSTVGSTGGAGPIASSASGGSTSNSGGGMGGASTSSTSSTVSTTSSTSTTTSTSSTSSTSSTTATSSTASSSAGSGGGGGGGGPCLPAFELCATPTDENCDGLGCVGAHVVSTRFGTGGDQRSKSVAAAGSDAILLGIVLGATDLGVGVLPELGDPTVRDLFLARYTPTLSALWQKRFADTAAGGVAVTASGDLLVAGGAIGDVDFGGGVLTGSPGPVRDVVVARFDASGKHLWSHRWSAPGDQIANAVAATAMGDAVMTGSFVGNLAIGPGAPLVSVGTSDLFVARLNPAGNPIWSKAFGNPGYLAQSRSVAVDGSGNIVIAGSFTGTLDLGAPALVSQGDHDIFVAKLDSTGTPLWSRAFGGPGADKAFSVAVGPSGSVAVTGAFHGLVTFGALPPVASPTLADSSSFVVTLDAAGTPLWVRSQSEPMGMVTGVDQQGLGVEVDLEGNAVVTGWSAGTTAFDVASPGTSTRVSPGGTDVFVAKYGPTGSLYWARIFGDAGLQAGASVAIDPLGNVWSTGYFSGTVDFGAVPPAPLTSVGAADTYLARLSP
jgi:hypothetical protein